MKKLMLLSSLVMIFFGTTAFVKVKEANDVKAFAKFLTHFEKVEMPFEVGLGDFEKYRGMQLERTQNKKKQEAYRNDLEVFRLFIPELKMKKMSRLGPPEVMPVARYYPSDKMVAIIYMSFHPFMDSHIDFSLALFDLKGRPIKTDKKNTFTYGSNNFHLGTISLNMNQAFRLEKDGQITQKEYTAMWEKDLEQNGVEGNEIVGYELKNTQYVELMDNGNFKALKHVQSLAGSQP